MAAAIKIVSLFCGCGGMDLGMIGGFDFLGKAIYKITLQDYQGR